MRGEIIGNMSGRLRNGLYAIHLSRMVEFGQRLRGYLWNALRWEQKR